MNNLKKLAWSDPRIESISDERNNGNGIIVYLNPGYRWGTDPGCGTRGFDNIREIHASLWMIQRDT